MCHSTFKPVWMSTPGGSDGKESACNVGDWDLIPGSGRSPGGGNGNPVQYSCLENPTDRGAWRTTVYRVTKSRTRLNDLHCLTCSQILTNKLCDLVSKSTCLSLSFHIYKTGSSERWVSPSWRRSVLGVHWKDWCWSWNSNTLATSCEELTCWKRPWCWEGSGAGGEGDDRGWDGWMASPTQWTWVWVNFRSLWRTGRPGVLQFMGSQRVGHDWATELNWKVQKWGKLVIIFIIVTSCALSLLANFTT